MEGEATGTVFERFGKGINPMAQANELHDINELIKSIDSSSDVDANIDVDKIASDASGADSERDDVRIIPYDHERKEHLDAFDARRESILKRVGLDIRAIYCSATGREIGQIDLDSCALTNLDCSDNQLVEELLLSARPSSGWIVKRKESFKYFRKSDPVGLLTFLVASLFDAMESKAKRASSDNFGHTARWKSITYHVEYLHNKILLRRFLDSLYTAKPESLCKAVDRALELDARQGLASIHPPYNLSFNQLVENFNELFPKLMTHCETELEAARQHKHSKEANANYYARQAAMSIIRTPSKSQKMREQASQEQSVMINAFLQQLNFDSIDDLRDLNSELDAEIKSKPQTKKPQSDSKYKPPLNEKSIADQISARLDEYQRQTAKSHIVSANKLKLAL